MNKGRKNGKLFIGPADKVFIKKTESAGPNSWKKYICHYSLRAAIQNRVNSKKINK
jgi:hypothetical protein